MIKKITLESLGPIGNLSCDTFGKINVLIGGNGSGKTIMMKALYASIKTIEAAHRGKENRTEKEILSEKLYWTYQINALSGLVRKGSQRASLSIEGSGNKKFSFALTPSTVKNVSTLSNTFGSRNCNSIFLPAKEILSLKDIVTTWRDQYNDFGFDNTYYDLVKALRPTKRGRNYDAFSKAREALKNVVHGKIEYDINKKEWYFIDANRRRFEIEMTSEGIKKISILDALLGNHYLSKDSVIFIDEIEANLHPTMIAHLIDIIYTLAKTGIQFFVSTHSYFVIVNMSILAQQHKMSIPVLSFENGEVTVSDLKEDMPQNAIIDESIRLYKKQLGVE